MRTGDELCLDEAGFHVEQTELRSRLCENRLRLRGNVKHLDRFVELKDRNRFLFGIVQIPNFRRLVHAGGDDEIVRRIAHRTTLQNHNAPEMRIDRRDQLAPFDLEDVHRRFDAGDAIPFERRETNVERR